MFIPYKQAYIDVSKHASAVKGFGLRTKKEGIKKKDDSEEGARASSTLLFSGVV